MSLRVVQSGWTSREELVPVLVDRSVYCIGFVQFPSDRLKTTLTFEFERTYRDPVNRGQHS